MRTALNGNDDEPGNDSTPIFGLALFIAAFALRAMHAQRVRHAVPAMIGQRVPTTDIKKCSRLAMLPMWPESESLTSSLRDSVLAPWQIWTLCQSTAGSSALFLVPEAMPRRTGKDVVESVVFRSALYRVMARWLRWT
jgi:hypothetical protein